MNNIYTVTLARYKREYDHQNDTIISDVSVFGEEVVCENFDKSQVEFEKYKNLARKKWLEDKDEKTSICVLTFENGQDEAGESLKDELIELEEYGYFDYLIESTAEAVTRPENTGVSPVYLYLLSDPRKDDFDRDFEKTCMFLRGEDCPSPFDICLSTGYDSLKIYKLANVNDIASGDNLIAWFGDFNGLGFDRGIAGKVEGEENE